MKDCKGQLHDLHVNHSAAALSLALARSFTLSDFNCPQAAKMSRPRGVRIGEA